MAPFEFRSDRIVDSTDNNEYADGDRDETLWEEDIVDTDIPVDDTIPGGLDGTGEEQRPEYSEEGFREDIGE